MPKSAAGQWQFIIKIARVRRKKARKSAYAFEAKNMHGDIMFCGVTSSTARSAHGFQRILILISNSKSLIQVMNKEKKNPRLAREDHDG